MFDDFAIHVANVEATVWTIGEVYRAEPVVARAEKFDLGFVARTFGYWLAFAGFVSNGFSVNQITAGIADECVVVK